MTSTPSPSTADDQVTSSGRYLSLPDRLAIADGLANGQTETAIATAIRRDKSTVSREVNRHSIDGLFCLIRPTRPPRRPVPAQNSPNW